MDIGDQGILIGNGSMDGLRGRLIGMATRTIHSPPPPAVDLSYRAWTSRVSQEVMDWTRTARHRRSGHPRDRWISSFFFGFDSMTHPAAFKFLFRRTAWHIAMTIYNMKGSGRSMGNFLRKIARSNGACPAVTGMANITCYGS